MDDKISLKKGSIINIKRTDGEIHASLVTEINYDQNYVKTEWTEEKVVKGKEIDFESVLKLNPTYKISRPRVRNKRNYVDACADKNYERHNISESVTETVRKKSVKSCFTSRNRENSSLRNNHSRNLRNSNYSLTEGSLNSEQCKLFRRNYKAENPRSHTDKFGSLNSEHPYWKLQDMINEYRKTIKILPLNRYDKTEDHLITVCVRKRPLNEREMMKKEIDIVTVCKKNQLIVHEPKNRVDLTKYLDNHIFNFDFVFDETCSNEVVYKYTAKPLIGTVFEGGCATCFAYGQTGSGKTYTMSGNMVDGNNETGIYVLVARDLFRMLNQPGYDQYTISASYFEIYSRKALDLLNDKASLKVLEDGRGKVQVLGLTEKLVYSVQDVLKLLELGNLARSSGKTSANVHSSRSHAIFQVQVRRSSDMRRVHGTLSLIDLAGNERGADTSLADKRTRLEGAEINKSLLALKECIRALGKRCGHGPSAVGHLPFRVSKLTQVLKDSFIGPRSRTCMIAMVSPNVGSCEHSLNTLRYADRVKELGGTERHVSTPIEPSPDDCVLLGSIQERTYDELAPPPNNLEVRVAEKKVLDSQIETTMMLLQATEHSKRIALDLESGVCDPETYCREWQGTIDDCLSLLLNAKELVTEFHRKLLLDK